jgi:hypothetical protein
VVGIKNDGNAMRLYFFVGRQLIDKRLSAQHDILSIQGAQGS